MTQRKKVAYRWQDKGLNDLEGEKWDDIPFLDGAYQLSTFGRMKSLRRWVETGVGGYFTEDRILTPRVHNQVVSNGTRKIDRLVTGLTFEGKKYHISIARLVYYLFVKKFDLNDRRLVVSPIDENGLNLTLDNLKLTTPATNITKAYKKGYRPRDSFGHKAYVISQYSLKGDWVATYLSISEAERITGISSSGIYDALARHRKHGGNFLWRYGTSRTALPVTKKIIAIVASQQFHTTVVSQFDFTGRKIREYKNLKDAARSVKTQAGQIRRAILGSLLSVKGYYWKLGPYPGKIDISQYEDRRQEAKAKIIRPVTQYDFTGKKIASYGSIAEAARSLDVSTDHLYYALTRPLRSISTGFLWDYGIGPKKVTPGPAIQRKAHLEKLYQLSVTQYDQAGKRIATYTSLKVAASAVGGKVYQLVPVVEGRQAAFRGYFWRRGEGNPTIDVTADLAITTKRSSAGGKPVALFSRLGEKIAEYESFGAAATALKTGRGWVRQAVEKKKTFPGGSFLDYKVIGE